MGPVLREYAKGHRYHSTKEAPYIWDKDKYPKTDGKKIRLPKRNGFKEAQFIR